MANGHANDDLRRGFASPPARGRRRAPAGTEPTLSPDILAEMVWDFVKRRGILAIPLALLLGVACGTAVFLTRPVHYTAEAEVQIDIPPDVPAHTTHQYLKTMIDSIKSDQVLDDALDMPQAMATRFVQQSVDPVTTLKQQLEVERNSAESQVVSIGLSGSGPEELSTLVNAVVDAFTENEKLKRDSKIRDRSRQYESEKQQAEQAIKQYYDQIARISREHGHNNGKTLEGEVEQLREVIAKASEDRQALLRDKVRLDVEYATKQDESTELTVEQIAELLRQTEGLRKEAEALDRMEANLQDRYAQTRNRETNPEYQRAMQFIRVRRLEYLNEKQGLLEIAKAANEEAKRKELDELRARREALGRTLEQVEGEINAKTQRLQTLAAARSAIEALREKVVEQKERRADVRDRLNDLLDLNVASNNVQVNSRARVPKQPTLDKKQLLLTLGATLFPIVVILGGFGLMELRARPVTRATHLERMLDVPLLGILPRLPAGVRLPKPEDFGRNSRTQYVWLAMQEAINGLRIMLTFAPDRRGDGLKSLMVTSARDGEGKSTLSAHLAVSLARSGVKVCLIEADLHRPTQFETFEVERMPGLTDVLSGRVEVDEAIHRTNYPQLDLLTAGSEQAELASILTPERLGSVLDHLGTRYDTILVDAPPVLPISDAQIIGQVVERAIVAVMVNHSQVHAVQQACQRLDAVGIPVAGVVVAGGNPVPKYYETYYQGYAPSHGRNGASGSGGYSSPPGLPAVPAQENGHERVEEGVPADQAHG